MKTSVSSGAQLTKHIIEANYPKKRLTTNEEFNADGEYMVRLKKLLMRAKMDSTEEVYQRVLNYASNKSNQLRIKHWGK